MRELSRRRQSSVRRRLLNKGPLSKMRSRNGFASIILPHIGAGESEMLVCGMSLGYADETALINTFRTPRVPAAELTTWLE